MRMSENTNDVVHFATKTVISKDRGFVGLSNTAAKLGLFLTSLPFMLIAQPEKCDARNKLYAIRIKSIPHGSAITEQALFRWRLQFTLLGGRIFLSVFKTSDNNT